MITFDFETKSYADLVKVGTWAYSEDPTTDVICCAYGIDHEPVQTWWPGKNETDDVPMDLAKAYVYDFHTVEAHNVAFERSIWMNVMTPKYGWPPVPDEQWRDTMAVACYYSMPASLDKLARVLGFPGKNPEGGRLITKYSKLHLKTAEPIIPDHYWVDWKDMTATVRQQNPDAKENGGYYCEDFQKFVEYCKDDVLLEQAVSDHLGDLPDRELPVFHLDQRINLRGLYLDKDGIECATKIVEQRSEELVHEFTEITGLKPTQTAKVLVWFNENGLELDNLQAGPLQELFDDGEIPSGPARRALEIRLEISKASTKKLAAMARQVGVGNRARFQTRYHGAATGRWTGSGFQPLNLVRNVEDIDPEDLVRDIMYGDAEWLDTVYGDAMDAVSKASRHWIMAEPGHKILSGDWVSIEAVILACLAGEQWKINAFAQGVKIYEHMADKIYGLAAGTVSKSTHPAERKDGKTGELAFGYQGALGAWLKFDNSGRHSDERIVEICKTWRGEHPATVSFWEGLQTAAIRAVRRKERIAYRAIEFELVDEWLTMILPSGKRLWYFKPQVKMGRPHWCQPKVDENCALGTCNHDYVPKLSYWAMKTGQWLEVTTYGGKLAENACQATSREILVPAMLRAQSAGYDIILSVYDEIVAEVPENFGSLDEFLGLMRGPLPNWADGWPIEVDGWEGQRYRK